MRPSRPVRLAAVLAALLAAAPAALAARVQEPSPPVVRAVTFLVSGRGYGHGIGMSQYGALGYARRGAGYDAILAHYYPGTQLGGAPLGSIRVLLAEHAKRFTVSSAAPFRVRDATGAVLPVAAPEVAVDAALRVPVGRGVRALAPPLEFLPGERPLRLDGKPYRGTFSVDTRAGLVHCVNTVGLDAYVSGVVSLEMPHDWPLEAQKAQAVAARSYALASRTGAAAVFDVYGDTRSQVYGGIEAETAEGRAAVAATAGEVLLYGGRVAWTYFSSSSGGRTANLVDEWPDTKPQPYLVSVDDPLDREVSPYARWGPVTLAGSQVARALRVPGTLLDLRPVRSPTGRVAQVVAVSDRGETVVRGTDFRFALGLRSTWLSIAALALERPAAPVPYGSAPRLAGLVRGLAAATLERRVPGAEWEPVQELQPGPDGRFSVAVRPEATADYRLAAGGEAGAVVRLAVARGVRLGPAAGGAGLAGAVAPPRAGLTVQLQKLDDAGAWATIRRASTGADGSFAFPFVLPPGGYRAAVAAAAGLAPGASAPVEAGG